MKKNSILEKLMDKIPLNTSIKVGNEMAFIHLITELGFREDKMWSKDEDVLYGNLMRLADNHTLNTLEHIDEHCSEKKLKEMFDNNFNCYTTVETDSDGVVQEAAITRDMFVSLVRKHMLGSGE